MRVILFTSMLVIVLSAVPVTRAQEQIIYSFGGAPDGSDPTASVVVDGKTGVVYGTTSKGGAYGQGTVFQLTPPSTPGGFWTEKILHSFGEATGDGAYPGALIETSQAGILYGTTWGGGANNLGTVFGLVPPSGPNGSWAESVIHSFGATGDGARPVGRLALDSQGILYGLNGYGSTTYADGVVYKLAPPQSSTNAGTETILYGFSISDCIENLPGIFSVGDMIFDGSTGNLYGSGAQGCGLGNVFQLVPTTGPSPAWNLNFLHLFSETGGDGAMPTGALADVSGVLYGTTFYGGSSGQGTAFQLLSPLGPGGSWTEQAVYSFMGGNDGANPLGGLVALNGGLYGTTSTAGTKNSGTIFALTPSSSGSWIESVVYDFQGAPDGASPGAALTVVPNGASNGLGNFYGTTQSGGTNNLGAVFIAALPLPPGTPSPLTYRATCDLICFDNTLTWNHLPPLSAFGPNSISFQGSVQTVADDGRTVQFAVRQVLPPARAVKGVEGESKLTVTFVHPESSGQESSG
jgi:uncharacterized repeat protein (TIGR03803 family)